jgi:hypothetical protein
VVLNYTVKPLVTQVYSHRGARLSEVPTSSVEISSDVSSSSLEMSYSPPVVSSSPIGSPPEQLLGRGQRIRRPPNCYSPLAFTTTALSEPASYRDAILYPEWQHVMAEEIAALERTGTWDLYHVPHVFVRLLVSGYIRLRLALMVLLSDIRLVLLLVVFSRSMVEIMMRLFLLLLI